MPLFGKKKPVNAPIQPNFQPPKTNSVPASPVVSPATNQGDKNSISTRSVTSDSDHYSFEEGSFASNDDLVGLNSKDPKSWTVNDVTRWLQGVGLGEYAHTFKEEGVAGVDLIELSEADFDVLKIKKLGDKKKFLRNISTLKTKRPFDMRSKSSRSSVSEVSDTDDDSDDETGPLGLITVRVVRREDPSDTRTFELDDPDVDTIKKRIKSEYGQQMIVKWRDNEGELTVLHDDRSLRKALKNRILNLVAVAASFISETEGKLLQSLVDCVIIIDKKGYILFVNKAVEQTFGYSAKQLINKNVKMLMTKQDAKHHNSYLRNYLKTGINQVIGRGRNVTCTVADGSTFSARLTVSESNEDGRHHFTGTLHRLEENVGKTQQIPLSSQFMVLDAILDASIVINELGTIQFFNKAAEKFFGYSKSETHGQNVKMLMPDPFRSEHDVYLSNYHRSKIPKVIGTGRDVPIQGKDGSIMPAHLKLTELEINNKAYYTGIISPRVDDKPAKSALETEREVLNGLLIPAIVINPKGIIQAFNPPACKLFDYSLTEVIGRNITMLMGGNDKIKHDGYLSAYVETGKSKIIGIGRKVVAVKKNQDTVACRLWVTEKHDGTKKFYSGILQPE